MKKWGVKILLVLLFLNFFSCYLFADNFIGKVLYAKFNINYLKNRLHYSNPRVQSYRFIPVGTKVKITNISKRWVTFISYQDNLTYYLKLDGHSTIENNIKKFFSEKDPKSDIATLSKWEQNLIDLNRIEKGMSKKAVLYCFGPPYYTPDYEENRIWIYQGVAWGPFKKRFALYFDANWKVADIRY
ncbi:MAG: hypothetical protein JRI44_09340 [Deltaproteobacteria bacterium]|nr:hypothetical protein [Deltaproteobacteria bacterium]